MERRVLGEEIPAVDDEPIELPPTLIEPEWRPNFDPENGLRLWDCILLALENNRPLRNAREDLREAFITLRERRDEFGNIYFLGAGAHFDENSVISPIARTDGDLERDRYSFSFGGRDSDGTVVSRQFPSGGTLSLGAQTFYNSQTATRLKPFVDPNGDIFFLSNLQDVRFFSEANLIVTQPLLEGAGNVATTGLRIQQIEQAAQSLGLERQIQGVISSVVQDYLNVQLQVSIADIQQQAYDRAVEFYVKTLTEDIKWESYRARPPIPGPVPEEERSKGKDPLEKVRSEQQITSTKQRLIDAKNQVESSLIDLRLTMGLEPDTAIVLAGTDVPTVIPPPVTLDEAIAYGLAARPDYKVFELTRRQAEINLDAAENSLLPNLDLNWRMAFREQDDDYLESLGVFDYRDAGADLRLELPLNLPADRANYDRAQVLIRQTLNNLEQQKRIVVNEVDEAYRAQATLLDRISVLVRNEELARRTYEIVLGTEDVFRNITPFDVAQSQDEWTAASSERVRAQTNYVIATAALDFFMGRPISELLIRYAPPGAPVPSP
jgi:outer membrane protein TolC